MKLMTADNAPVEIMKADTGTISVGREPGNHVVVDSESVSRQHAIITEAGDLWLYKDLESTNGSWINGVKLSPGQMRLLRDGDVLQLADFPMKFQDLQRQEPLLPSLLVFSHGRFSTSIPLDPETFFSIGGPDATFELEGVPQGQSVLEISYQGSGLELSAAQGPRAPMVNGMIVNGVASLNDRDEVHCGHYLIVINEPSLGRAPTAEVARPGAGTSPPPSRPVQAFERPPSEEGEWESEASRRRAQSGRKFVFGSGPDGENAVTSTMAIPRAAPGRTGFEMSASQRFSAVIDEEDPRAARRRENLQIIFGMIFFFAMIGLAAYFFLAG